MFSDKIFSPDKKNTFPRIYFGTDKDQATTETSMNTGNDEPVLPHMEKALLEFRSRMINVRMLEQ